MYTRNYFQDSKQSQNIEESKAQHGQSSSTFDHKNPFDLKEQSTAARKRNPIFGQDINGNHEKQDGKGSFQSVNDELNQVDINLKKSSILPNNGNMIQGFGSHVQNQIQHANANVSNYKNTNFMSGNKHEKNLNSVRSFGQSAGFISMNRTCENTFLAANRSVSRQQELDFEETKALDVEQKPSLQKQQSNDDDSEEQHRVFFKQRSRRIDPDLQNQKATELPQKKAFQSTKILESKVSSFLDSKTVTENSMSKQHGSFKSSLNKNMSSYDQFQIAPDVQKQKQQTNTNNIGKTDQQALYTGDSVFQKRSRMVQAQLVGNCDNKIQLPNNAETNLQYNFLESNAKKDNADYKNQNISRQVVDSSANAQQWRTRDQSTNEEQPNAQQDPTKKFVNIFTQQRNYELSPIKPENKNNQMTPFATLQSNSPKNSYNCRNQQQRKRQDRNLKYLYSNQANKAIGFYLYDDKEIGLGTENVVNCVVETTQDDDVATDQGVMEHARSTCMNDLRQVQRTIQKELKFYYQKNRSKSLGAPRMSPLKSNKQYLNKVYNRIVRNSDVTFRCRYPHNYDRNGHFTYFDDEEPLTLFGEIKNIKKERRVQSQKKPERLY